MKSEQIELGGITITDKTKDGEEKKVNAGEIVVDVIAEKRKEQEKLEAERRNEWKKFKQDKQETEDIDPDLLKETDEELVAGNYGFNPDGTKREKRGSGRGDYKKIDLKRITRNVGRGKRQETLDLEASEEYPQEKRGYEKRQDEEKIENPELAEKINRMAELSEKSWKLKQEEKYEDMNEIVKELISLYYRDVKEELGDVDDVYKIKGVSEESAKRARGAVGRIENGETYIKVGYEKLDNRDVEDLLKINKDRNIDEILDMVNKVIDDWGKKKMLLSIEKNQEPEYKIKFFDPNTGHVELETKDGKKGKPMRAEYLYIINQDKTGKETKVERTKEEVLTAFKDNKTLLRIKKSKESADSKYVLVVYNPGAEYSYVETVDGKDRQRIRSEEVYKLNIDVIDKIEKPGAEMAK